MAAGGADAPAEATDAAESAEGADEVEAADGGGSLIAMRMKFSDAPCPRVVPVRQTALRSCQEHCMSIS